MIEMKIDVSQIKDFAKRIKQRADSLNREVSVELNNWGSDVQVFARQNHKFQTQSGALERSVSKKMSVSGVPRLFLFLDAHKANHAKFIHDGTQDHEISPKNKKALRFVGGNGYYFSKGHKVKGIKVDPFLKEAIEKNLSTLQTRINKVLSRKP